MLSKKAFSGNWTGPVFCERCGKKLDPRKIVWLELDSTSGNYTDKPLPEGHESQGAFSFGKDCAKIVVEGISVKS